MRVDPTFDDGFYSAGPDTALDLIRATPTEVRSRVVIGHNPLYTPRELRKQFEDHGAKHAIVWTKVVRSVPEFPADLEVTSW